MRAFAVLFLAAASWLMLPFPGTDDVRAYWLPWMRNLRDLGVVHGFAANRGDYPPGTSIVFSVVARLGQASGVDDFIALKWSILVFLCIASWLFWLWTRNLRLTILFHLALLFESLALGYVDIYVAPLFIGAMWAVAEQQLELFSALFSAACLMKWQPLIVAPFVLVHVLGVRFGRDWRSVPPTAPVLRVLGPAALVVLSTLLVFGRPVVEAFTAATAHPYLSGRALNFCWVITHWIRAYHPARFGGLINGQAEFITTRQLRYTLLPRILFVGSYAGLLVLACLREKTFLNLIRFSLLGYLAYFTFNTGVHENHLFLAVILGAILYWRDASAGATAFAIALLNYVNLFLFYGVDGSGYRFSRLVAGVDVALLLAVSETLFFLMLCVGALATPRQSLESSPRASSG